MAELRAELPPLPDRFARLPISDRGYPVPWFVSWLDEDNEPLPRGEGRPDFRVIYPGAIAEGWNRQKCWLCGDRLGRHVAFVIGSMCAINQVNSEPPCHRDCADFAARACPFLARPHAKRRPTDDIIANPEEAIAGKPVLRNPGVACVWITERRRVRPFKVENGWLFSVGEPNEVRWYAEGEPATREQVLASIESGLHLLQAEADAEGGDSPTALACAFERTLALLPA